MKGRIKEILTKFIMFSATSGVGTLVDLGVLWVFSHYVFNGTYWGEFWLSPFISFECAVLTNFVIAYYFVWRERISRRSTRSFFRHYAAYNATCTGVFLVKMAILQGVHFLFPSLDVVWCNLLALCLSGGINFFMSEWVIFRKTTKK
ncbi:MAG: GtrA family protein [Bacteroidales bacterium]|nr:GtrA family protein [Bacteroidales bacterium]